MGPSQSAPSRCLGPSVTEQSQSQLLVTSTSFGANSSGTAAHPMYVGHNNILQTLVSRPLCVEDCLLLGTAPNSQLTAAPTFEHLAKTLKELSWIGSGAGACQKRV